MAVTKEQITLPLVLSPEIDQRAAAQAIKSATDLYKKVSKMKVEFGQVAKASNVTLKEIQGITAAAGLFSKTLSTSAKSATKELRGLGTQLADAHAEAAALEKAYKGAKGGKAKAAVGAAQEKQVKIIQGLNKDIQTWRKSNKAYETGMRKMIKGQVDYQRTLKQASKFGAKDMMKGVGSSVAKMLTGGTSGMKAGLGDLASTLGKGTKSKLGKAGQSGAGGASMKGMAQAVKGMAVAASAISVFVQLLMKATAHMSQLNKAMLQGATMAGDSALSAKQYAKVMKDLRDAAIDSTGEMLAFGMNSEKALSTVAAFSTEATGSLAQTSSMLKQMGKGDLNVGLLEFSRMAVVYGKSLGMESEQVASMMGTFVSEVGYGAEGATQAMSMIVKDAAAANMPVGKFMDIFRQTIPSLDMYTNRMEELTGVIKTLSKTMSAKDVKQFMEAFGAGFDQVDFKQRLKIALVAGVGNVGAILKKDFANAAQSLEKQMPDVLKKSFRDAMNSPDPVKAMTKVLAKAQASGEVSGATIGAAQKLARSQRLLKRGGATNIAGAMRGAGKLAQLQISKKAAGIGGQGFEGLGEHITKKITGWSEKQYASFLQFEDNMGLWTQQLKDVGSTGSDQMNQGLKSLLNITDKGGAGDKELQARMKEIAKQNPAKATEMVQQAMIMQVDEEKKIGNVQEELAKEQVNATLSLGDKIENVLGFLLEKIYWIMDEVFGFLSADLWGWITGSDDSKAANKHLSDISKEFKLSHKGDEAALQAHQESIDNLKKLNTSGADNNQILGESQDLLNYLGDSPALMKQLVDQGALGDEGQEISDLLTARNKTGNFTEDQQKRWDAATDSTDISSKQLISTLATVATSKASWEAKGPGSKKKLDYPKGKPTTTATKTSKELAAEKADFAKITKDAYDAQDRAAGVTPPTAGAPALNLASAMRGAGDKAFVNPYTQPEDTGFGSDAFMKKIQESGDEQVKTDEKIAEAQTKTAEALTDDQVKADGEIGKEQKKATEDVYAGIKDVAGILKKGIRFEKSFLTGAYSDALKTSTLESFQTALMEHAAIMIKATGEDNLSEFGKGVANEAWHVIQSGVSAQSLSLAGDQAGVMRKVGEAREGHQDGASIRQTGNYTLHKGEAVLDAMTYESVKRQLRGGASAGSVVMNITINGTDLSQQQLKGAILQVQDEMARRH